MNIMRMTKVEIFKGKAKPYMRAGSIMQSCLDSCDSLTVAWVG